MKYFVLCSALICLFAGCDEPTYFADQPVQPAKAPEADPRTIENRRPGYVSKMESNRQDFLQTNRAIVAKAQKDIEEHTAAMNDKNDTQGREYHEKLIQIAEREKSNAEKVIKEIEANAEKRLK